MILTDSSSGKHPSQAVLVVLMLVYWYWFNYLKDLPDLSEWKIAITFIVIDKYNQAYPFQVSTETMAIWQQDFDEVTDVAKYHYESKDFTLPYDLIMGNVKL